MVRVTFALVSLILLAGVPGVVAEAGTDRLEYRYAAGFAATGQFEGECEAAGFRLPEATPGRLRVHHGGGQIVVSEARVNYTVWAESRVEWHGGTVRFTSHPLPPGVLDVAWDRWGHVHGYRPAEGSSDVLRAPLVGRQWDAGPSVRYAPTGPAYFVPDAEAGVRRIVDPIIEGPLRSVRTDATNVTLEGVLGVRAMQARFEQGTEVLELPVHERAELRDGGGLHPVVSERVWIEVHADAFLQNATLVLPQDEAELYCSGLAWGGEGSVHFRNANGQARVDLDDVAFNVKELTVAGRFESQEAMEVAADATGEQAVARGQATGDFSALGLDFQSVLVKPTTAPALVQVGFWALAGALLLASLSQFSRLVGLFYTRLDESTALKHPLRKQLLDVVRQRPGLLHNDAVAATGQPRGVVRHHLRVLETVGLLRSLRTGKEIHLYPRGANLDQEKKSLLLEKDAPVRFLVERARAAPLVRAAASQDLRTQFTMSRMGAWKAIRRAVEAGLLRTEPTRQGDVLRPVDSVPG